MDRAIFFHDREANRLVQFCGQTGKLLLCRAAQIATADRFAAQLDQPMAKRIGFVLFVVAYKSKLDHRPKQAIDRRLGQARLSDQFRRWTGLSARGEVLKNLNALYERPRSRKPFGDIVEFEQLVFHFTT